MLELACERLEEMKYNPLTSNCEHFCTDCKIGNAVSVQVGEESLVTGPAP